MVGDLKYSREEAFSCKEYIKQSLDDALMYLFENYEPIAKLKRQLIDASNELYAKIEERKEYSLIHFELGPNHVMVDQQGKTYIIDFEGMKYFDLEYEYSFF
ncbi:phosphotransferase [Paenibacillus lutimineralis]|nr:phosphotransferase [Paenibacillus lutimineralis]